MSDSSSGRRQAAFFALLVICDTETLVELFQVRMKHEQVRGVCAAVFPWLVAPKIFPVIGFIEVLELSECSIVDSMLLVELLSIEAHKTDAIGVGNAK